VFSRPVHPAAEYFPRSRQILAQLLHHPPLPTDSSLGPIRRRHSIRSRWGQLVPCGRLHRCSAAMLPTRLLRALDLARPCWVGSGECARYSTVDELSRHAAAAAAHSFSKELLWRERRREEGGVAEDKYHGCHVYHFLPHVPTPYTVCGAPLLLMSHHPERPRANHCVRRRDTFL